MSSHLKGKQVHDTHDPKEGSSFDSPIVLSDSPDRRAKKNPTYTTFDFSKMSALRAKINGSMRIISEDIFTWEVQVDDSFSFLLDILAGFLLH